MEPDKIFQGKYRGFKIGARLTLGGYCSMWKSSLEDEWICGHILADDIEDCWKLGWDCIDFNYKIETFEVINKRRPSCMEMKEL